MVNNINFDKIRYIELLKKEEIENIKVLYGRYVSKRYRSGM
jgi:hypothetical protein